jgi:hypothetical protein
VTISDSYAYLTTGRDGFRIYNISNPTNLISLGHFDNHSITPNFTPYSGGIALSGNYAFVANGSDGLRVFDISNRSNPTNIFNINNGGNALSIVISNNYAFLANNDDGIRIYDISNPTNVINIGHVDAAYSTRLFISGSYLFSANDVAHNPPAREFSSAPVLRKPDALPCCCGPTPPARIFQGSRIFRTFSPCVSVAMQREALDAKLTAS